MTEVPGRFGASLPALAAAMLFAACYRYVPVEPAEAPVGAEVRAHLAERARARLQPLLRGTERHLDGEVLGRGTDTLLLELPVAMPADGLRTRELSQRVNLSHDDILALELKELDRVRTAALVAGLGTGVVVLAAKALSGRTESQTLPPGGGPPEIVVPIVIPFPR